MNIKLKKGKIGSIEANMLLSGIYKPLGMILSYIYTPIVMNYLGDEKYGIWTTILSIITWILYFDVGIGNGLRNELTASLNREDQKSAKALVSSAYIIIFLIVTVIFVVFLFSCGFIDYKLFLNSPDSNENITLILGISVAFICINFTLSLCNTVCYALQKASLASLSVLMGQIVNLIAVIALRNVVPNSLLAVATLYGMANFAVNIIFSVIIYKKHTFLIPSIRCFDKAKVGKIANLGIQFFIIQIAGMILFTTDNLLVTKIFGADAVTTYSTVIKVFQIPQTVFVAFITPLWSAFTRAKLSNEVDWMKKTLKKLNMVMLLFIVADFCIALIFRPFTNIWLGRDLGYSNLLIVLGFFYAGMNIISNRYAYILNGLECMKYQLIIAVIQAVINIPLSLFFAMKCEMGMEGILLGTILSQLIYAVTAPLQEKRSVRKIKSGIKDSGGK